MGDLSEHFSRIEWECECGCGFDTVDSELVSAMEKMHSHFSKKYQSKIRILITGGNRCVDHNEEIQKAYNENYVPFSSKSTHMDAKANDFKVYYWDGDGWIQVEPVLVAMHLEKKYPEKYGIGRYSNRTHLDVRAKKARWGK